MRDNNDDKKEIFWNYFFPLWLMAFYTTAVSFDVLVSYLIYSADSIYFLTFETHPILVPFLKGGGEFLAYKSPITVQWLLGLLSISYFSVSKLNPKFKTVWYGFIIWVSLGHISGGFSWLI